MTDDQPDKLRELIAESRQLFQSGREQALADALESALVVVDDLELSRKHAESKDRFAFMVGDWIEIGNMLVVEPATIVAWDRLQKARGRA